MVCGVMMVMGLKKQENIQYMMRIGKQKKSTTVQGDALAVVIVAAGKSERLGGDVPKQYQQLGGQMMLRRSIEAMRQAMPSAKVWVVVHPDHHGLAQIALDNMGIEAIVDGGRTRQESVLNALKSIDGYSDFSPDWVMVHDAARPFVDEALVERVWAAREGALCVVPTCAVHDTLKMVEGGCVVGTIDRSAIRAVQTPHLASFSALLHAHNVGKEGAYTDDAALMEAAGHPVMWVEGSMQNSKVTTKEDMERARLWLHAERTQRVGMGYDVHPLVSHEAHVPAEQQVIMLGGIAIPFEMRCKGHSDADVILHAVVDALLGAIGEGDIGKHFPPSDIQWKNAHSSVFVEEAVRLMEARGGRVENMDVTYIGEVPRIGGYREAIQARIAELLNVAPQRVNVKATTTEKLGFEGRQEGVAAQAVVLVNLPAYL